MSVLKNALIKKILIVLMVVILINNFIIPNYVWAVTELDEKSVVGKLVSGLFGLFAYVGDAGISIMQNIFLGTGDITEKGEYAIKFSPGLIFSGRIAAFDINFINPGQDNTVTVTGQLGEFHLGDLDSSKKRKELFTQLNASSFTFIEEFQKKAGLPKDKLVEYGFDDDIDLKYLKKPSKSIVTIVDHSFKPWEHENVANVLDHLDEWDEVRFWIDANNLYKLEIDDRLWPQNNSYYLYVCDLTTAGTNVPDLAETVTKESSARQLQGKIATWYVALRTVALVGLLSVLVYIGIRIILSSASSQDKAKYKGMLKDWVVAICILFVLHYIMAFMLSLSEQATGMLAKNITSSTNLDGTTSDKLLSSLRNSISDNFNSAYKTAGYTIMYLALVILTGMFTIQYLKRVVYMAFLTMIAPLIALTYPMDKIKDGKAQAFSFWLREYIFNCLIQPVHLLLYLVLIDSAMGFAETNILYAIVALAFMVPAEKIIKEMFGLKSSSPSSTLGAAAGGAFMMSMLNKIKNKPSKDDEASGGKAPSGVRTASRGPIDSSNPGNNPQDNNSPDNNNPDNNNPPKNNPPKNNPPKNNPPRNQNNNNSKQGDYNILRGVGEITGVNRLLSAPGTTLRGAAKKGAKVTAGLALGGLAGTTMLANEIADGHLFEDPGGALSKAGGAAVAGYAGGNALVGNAAGTIEKNVDKFRKGAMGVEAYNNQAFDKQFFNSDNYKIIAQDPTIQQEWGKKNIKEVAQTFLDNGISDQNIIRSAMQNGVNGDEYKSISSMGVTDVKHYRKVRDKNKHKGLNASQVAARMQIAKNLPERLFNDESGFIRYAKRFGIDDENDARRLFSEIDDFT